MMGEAAVAPTGAQVDAERLRAFVAEVFRHAGLEAAAADIVADSLVWADLAGVDTHGVARVPSYVERLRKKLVNAAPRMSVESRMPFAASLDGDNAMGALVAERAMREALERARILGIGVVVARRSNHFGTAGYWARKAVSEGCIGICISPASKSLAPFGSKAPLFGTNPFAVAVPAGARAPWVMDLATSVAARGHIRLAAREARSIPEGWALDRDGHPTTDAARALEGVMLPFAGPKGSALSMLADILGGVLAGAAFGGEIRDMNTDFSAPQEVGHFFMAMRVDAFMPAAEFAARMTQLIDRVKALPPAAGFDAVMYPGEPEARRSAERREKGIALSVATRAALAKVAGEFGLVASV
ncbi:MAG: Ldh family oxidoreductase [Betaproteobacteria bacterium]|nr:Ldh family oxidoreductase [Betaproteobacteria bacterium]